MTAKQEVGAQPRPVAVAGAQRDIDIGGVEIDKIVRHQQAHREIGMAELEAPDPAHGARLQQQRLGLVDEAGLPAPRILLGERHVSPFGIAPRFAARLGMEHEGEEAERLRLVRQQRRHKAS